MKTLRRSIIGVLPPKVQNELVFKAVEARIGSGSGGLVGGFRGVAGAGGQCQRQQQKVAKFHAVAVSE
jgi:hypothetical protein